MVNYIYKPYTPTFPEIFEKEKLRLQAFLNDDYIIEHFGSTAVPGLGGKGIIDMYVIVAESQVQKIAEKLENAGYAFRPNAGNETRFVFIREEKERYHIHLTADKNEYQKDLLFRNWLCKHPEDKEKYAIIKQKAAREANQTKETYMRIKEPIIQEILAKALVELA